MSNPTIDSYHRQYLILKIETELKRLDKGSIDQFLSHVPQEILVSIKDKYKMNVKQYRNIVECYDLISVLTKLKAPINKSQ